MRTWSDYQNKAFNAVANSRENLFASAVAGSGKTTFLVEACSRLPKNVKAVFCAFNKSIAGELKTKLPSHVESQTLHAMGFGTIRKNLSNAVHLEMEKTALILKGIIKEESDSYKTNVGPIARLVSLAKNNLIQNPAKSDWDSLIETYGVVLPNGDFDWTALNQVYALASVKTYKKKIYNKFFRKEVELPVIDFDDMLYYPAIYGWNIADDVQVIFVDEAQDLNPTQIQLLQIANNAGSRIICTGDENQACYGWRGSSIESINSLLSTFKMDRLPLSISYRCSQEVVAYAKRFVEQIEARPNAPKGSVETVDYHKFMSDVTKFQHGDLVICRTNAPLVGLAYMLLRNNKDSRTPIKFRIQGVELGQELGRLIGYLTFKHKLADTDMEGLHKALSEYEQHMTERYNELKNGAKYLVELQDKLEVIMLVAANAKSISGARDGLCKLFADSNDRDCVLLSTIHRAKGLEVVKEDNVCYVLRTDLLPHPRATQDWELEQERNLIYIAYTRAKSNLVLVHKEREASEKTGAI